VASPLSIDVTCAVAEYAKTVDRVTIHGYA
jgi:hypothetical protein